MTVQYRVVVAKKDELLDGPDDADIVITGRVTDAAVVCGPAAWHHGWSRTDWNELAGAVVATNGISSRAYVRRSQ